jgi:hypothetical protein
MRKQLLRYRPSAANKSALGIKVLIHSINSNKNCPFLKFPDRKHFHRPQHLQIVPEVIGIGSVSDPVAVLKPGYGGIGGEKLLYQPKDDWDCRSGFSLTLFEVLELL